MLRWHSKKLGPLEVVRQRDVMADGKTPVCRYSIISYKKGMSQAQRAKEAETNARSKVTYRPHIGRNNLLYISRVFTRPGSRELGMTSSLISLICALEKKKLFIVPEKLAKRKKVYEKIGFRKGYVTEAGARYNGLVLDRPSMLKPQDWVRPGTKGGAVRKFFIK
jgi:hypothetical protein